MKRFHCDKDDNNADFIQIKTAKESGDGEVSFSPCRSIHGIQRKASMIRSTKRM